MSSAGRGGKRRGPPPPAPSGSAAKRGQPSLGTPQPPPPAAAAAPAAEEEDMMDEDVFLDEAILAEDEAALLMVQRDEALASRLSRWKRPALPADLVAGCSRAVGTTHPPFRAIFFDLYFDGLDSVCSWLIGVCVTVKRADWGTALLEIDYIIGESHKQLLPNSSGPAAILRIFGVTKEGHSICCQVHGFEPYFYISCPPGMGPDDISRFHQTLEGRMKESNRSSNVPRFVKRVELVQKQTIMHYQPHKSQPFLKIVVALPTMVASCRGILEKGITIEGLGSKCFLTYESNILFALRFMIDCNIVGGNWIEVPAGKHSILNNTTRYSDLISHAAEGEYSKMAPFRILSFDIECAGRKGHFPEPTHDPVIQIANLVTLQGEGQPFVRNVMTLKSCSPIVGVDVMSFETERAILLAWRVSSVVFGVDFIREVDPDIIIGYNICKFDLPYLIEAMQRDYKLSSYSLNSVSAHFLGEQDAYLPQRLLDKLMYIYNYVEMARVTGVPISFLLSRGQSIKVLEARAGFYEKPIATLDFASLYPSIMMAYNLCYCSLVPPDDARKLNLPPESLNRTPSGEIFVKPELQKGILPEILEELLAARKRAKADLKEAKDPFERAVLDGRQLALKISANSVYGFTGATVGQLPCLEISSSVTSYGRQMIEHTKKLVEDKFTTLGGYEHNAEPIKLEFEKVYFPYLLISKKRYAGLYWTNPEKFDKMDTKGIETVRRDNCLLVKNLVTECLHKILIDRDVPGAVQYVKNTISDLLMNRVDLSLLVITKGLTKTGEDYAVKSAHVELAERMRKRDAATAPTVGDRVPYVIIKAAKGAKAYEKSEDPIYVLDNNIPIDPQYYLENQISKPLLRIFEPILKNASKELLHGCKAVISGANQTLCSHCKGREAELYCKSVANVSELEMLFGRLWTQCQECQGSLHQDVLCTRRRKAQKDMAEARLQLDRWDF
ncbi:hypothetical protein PR202_ga25168 [Eleusine coracana subsp. coracana]|uniref:DNA polymerase delta catalytic subunit n=1 Tax=Eleusine coracana subsp. coracana TaxID=191504 RepID=A0AAV5D9H2_ELECO|nr:hypothetical protein PR202_ga25168 [Eleusine coracana subsp. coracana]